MSIHQDLGALAQRIERLESIEEIRQLPARYSLALDMRDLDALVFDVHTICPVMPSKAISGPAKLTVTTTIFPEPSRSPAAMLEGGRTATPVVAGVVHKMRPVSPERARMTPGVW